MVSLGIHAEEWECEKKDNEPRFEWIGVVATYGSNCPASHIRACHADRIAAFFVGRGEDDVDPEQHTVGDAVPALFRLGPPSALSW